MVLKTTWTSGNPPGTRVVAMSPRTTSTDAAAGSCAASARNRAAIGSDSSTPVTSTPRRASGTATRPVPTASSSARPSPASAARNSTAGSRTSGANMPAETSSWSWAASSPHTSELTTRTTPGRPGAAVDGFSGCPGKDSGPG